MEIYKNYLKRGQDFLMALIACIVLSPVLAGVAILIKLKLGSPILFKQERPGLNGKIFILYKFRTMTNEKDKFGNLLSDKERMTEFGEWLRSTSLDELPELFNILKGDLSFVGPRPQLVRDLVFMTSDQKGRHCVRPGLTGLAQINGRNDIDWDEKFKYDLEYIQKVTFLSDCKILIQTVCKVFKREGINTKGLATSEDLGDYLLRIGKITEEEYDVGQRKSKLLLKNSKKNKK